MPCTNCGACCDPVLMTPRDRFLVMALGPDATAERWGDPRLYDWVVDLIPLGGDEMLCPRFDPVSKLCTDYENRPGTCSGYPHYGFPRPTGLLPATCSFWVEVPLAIMAGGRAA